MHMVVDVELVSFLTLMYFENTSTTIRKSILFSKTNLLQLCAMEMMVLPESG